MKRKIIILIGLLCELSAQAQNDTLSTINLEEVIVKAFEQSHRLKDVPAAVNFIDKKSLDRYGPSSIVTALSNTPGVRMEERSPGSYRFNIRGSSLRSPFGVRNIKMYFNDLPFTQPGGQTYINQLGFYNFNSIEVIKGPGSSLYGAGTGGVLLVESLDEQAQTGALAEYSTGSYHLQNVYAAITTENEKLISKTGFQHQESDGYRDHTRIKRNVHSWNGLFRLKNNRELKTTYLYSDLFYETPGALTFSEFSAHPQMARPSAGTTPGAVQANAFIRQKTFMAGASYTQPICSRLQNKSTLYGAFTELRNPNLRAYDRTSEPNVGGRTVFTYTQPFISSLFSVITGAEWQQGFAVANSFKNINGRADSLRYYDDIRNRNLFLFLQASWEYNNWNLTAGSSWNQLTIKFQRFTPRALGEQKRQFDQPFIPRISLSKKLEKVTLYSSFSKGFSPPATAELLPTGGMINASLQAEEGTNYEVGLKGNFFKKMYIDINAFLFSLHQTIVQRRDAAGGDFFVNAGSTQQRGVESYISYALFTSCKAINRSQLWTSYTWHHFHYKHFKQLTSDFSGNQLPGIPAHTLASGFDIALKNGWQASVAYQFNSNNPLNDANTEYAPAYHLLTLKAGYDIRIHKKWGSKVFAGVDNLLNQKYSLGNDINGFGGRYYNAAPARNFYAGAALRWVK